MPTKALENVDSQILTLKGELTVLLEELEYLRGQLMSTRNVMNEVNVTLKVMGFINFCLDSTGVEIELHQIVRDDGSEAGYMLSEGENPSCRFFTSIAACDLLQKLDSENALCFVVDDPISSLDSEMILAISWLCRDLLAKCNSGQGRLSQVIVPTHNAQFLPGSYL